jgi:hypothetical protein
MPFKLGVDPWDGNVWTDPMGGVYRSGWMEWQIRKVLGTYSLFDSHTDLFGQGEKLYEKTKKSLPLRETFKKGASKSTYLPLYASANDQPPSREDEGSE